ncbi:unnamed protein product [Amaranthus hypochondriacus]
MLNEEEERQITIEVANKKWHDPSKFKKFDKKRRDQVLLWGYLSIFLISTIFCVLSFTIPSLKRTKPRGVAMWQWSLLITVLLGGPLVSKLIIVKTIKLFIDREFSAKENVIYFVVGLVESAWVVLWFSMILIAWCWVVDEPSYLGVPQENEKIMKKFSKTYPIVIITLITLIMGAFLWLLKDLVLIYAKSDFHIRRFFNRLRVALLHQYVIEVLAKGCDTNGNNINISDSNNNNVSIYVDDSKKGKFRKIRSFGRKEKTIIELSCLDDVNEDNVSCWGMKIVIDWIRENPHLNYNDYGKFFGGGEKKIDSEDIAIEVANHVFDSLVQHQACSNPHIGENELKRCGIVHKKLSEVKKCLLEGESQQISKEALKKWMVKAYKNRKALVRALEANKGIFAAFNKFIDVLLVFFIFALWLIMLNVETRKVIFVIATAIAGSAFVFGETFKLLVCNIFFLFWVHPFDIGDSCFIEDTPVIIEEINVLATTVLTLDNEIKHYPNAKLADQCISNYTRSSPMGDFIEFSLEANTSAHKINQLIDQVKIYIEKYSQYWHPEHHWVMDFESLTKVKMRLQFKHIINFHDYRETQIRKSKLVLEIKDYINNLKLI